MKDRIKSLADRIFNSMQEALNEENIEEISRLTPLSKRLKSLSSKLEALEDSLNDIDESLQMPADDPPAKKPKPIHTKSRRSHIRIEIDWEANGHSYPRQVIEESTSAASMVTLFSTLHRRIGIKVLENAQAFLINRGPLISSSPQKEFRNLSTGEIYGNSPIPGTKYNVLTHSETKQKVSDLRRFLKGVVGFRSDTFSVKKI